MVSIQPTTATSVAGHVRRADPPRSGLHPAHARSRGENRQAAAPIYDEAVASKQIQAWGWLAHSTGGEWRRAVYFVVPGRDAMFAATDAIYERLGKERPLAGREYQEICYAHNDYIWRRIAGSQPGGETAQRRPAEAFSTYMECDSAREDRADEIVKSVMAPLYDAQVAAHNLSSWNWFEHYVGSKYRRLAVVDGPSFKAIFDACDAIIEELQEKHADVAKEFNEICPSHQDYMWDIQIAKP